MAATAVGVDTSNSFPLDSNFFMLIHTSPTALRVFSVFSDEVSRVIFVFSSMRRTVPMAYRISAKLSSRV